MDGDTPLLVCEQSDIFERLINAGKEDELSHLMLLMMINCDDDDDDDEL